MTFWKSLRNFLSVLLSITIAIGAVIVARLSNDPLRFDLDAKTASVAERWSRALLGAHTWVGEKLTALKRGEGPADIVFVNATFWTADVARPYAEAVAVRGGKVLLAGSHSEIVRLAGRETEWVDLAGAFVTPGFIDSHVHFIDGGVELSLLDLRGCSGKDDFRQRVRQRIQEDKEKGEAESWLIGYGWSNDAWGGEFPSVSWVDDITGNRLTLLKRIDGHTALANSAALHKAGIGKHDPDNPPGGLIWRDTGGSPTGILADSAIPLVSDLVPPQSISTRMRGLRDACQHALAHGITTVVDVGNYGPGLPTSLSWTDLEEVYEKAVEAEELSVRVHAALPLATWQSLAEKVAEMESAGTGSQSSSDMLRIGALKDFYDGSVGSKTALFFEPYEGETDNRGLKVIDDDWLMNAVMSADKAGLQVLIHAIGDAAIDNVLSVYAAVLERNGHRDRRFRVEHAQHLVAGAAERFKALDVIASVQPVHLLEDGPVLEQKLGKDRAFGSSYMLHTLLQRNVSIPLGSDWPVAELDALLGIETAAERIPPGWTEPFISKERITREEALLGYTRVGAHAILWDDKIGSIQQGHWADFAVLSSNPLKAQGDEKALVVQTYVGGKCVYRLEETAA